MNKWALISGASSGIGKAFAFYFASQGYNIIATGTRTKLLQEVVKQMNVQYRVETIAFVGDLALKNVQSKLIDLAKEKKIAVLVNNAGYALKNSFFEGEIEKWLHMTSLHLECMLRLAHAVLPEMLSANEGIIINVASDAAYMTIKNNAVYSGTKAFIKQFTHGLYLDLINTNIFVQALCPGLTRTDFHEKMGMPRERQKNRGIIRWNTAENVVIKSIQALKKKKALCICGLSTKMQILLSFCMPKPLYYYIVKSLFK